MGLVERKQDESWVIPENYLDRARQYEAGKSAAKICVLSWVSVDQLIDAKAQTILDDVLEGKEQFDAVRHKFGEEIENSTAARRRWLRSGTGDL